MAFLPVLSFVIAGVSFEPTGCGVVVEFRVDGSVDHPHLEAQVTITESSGVHGTVR